MGTIKDWLGFSKQERAVGLHIGTNHVSVVAVRSNPMRVTAVGRQEITDASVVGDEIRSTRSLSADLKALVDQLRLAGSPVVATVEPADQTLSLVEDGRPTTCAVPHSSHDRLVEVVGRAGLRLVHVDPVPIAMARLSRFVLAGGFEGSTMVLRGAFRWSVLIGADFVEGERLAHGTGPRLCYGPDFGSTRPVEPEDLPIGYGKSIRSIIDLDRDAVALGAALGGLGLTPTVEVVPRAERRGTDWGIQSVSAPDLILAPMQRRARVDRPRSATVPPLDASSRATLSRATPSRPALAGAGQSMNGATR